MTTLLLSIGAGAGLLWIVYKFYTSLRDTERKLASASLEAMAAHNDNIQLSLAITTLQENFKKEKESRIYLEKALEEIYEQMSKHGPSNLSALVNSKLQTLRKMQKSGGN